MEMQAVVITTEDGRKQLFLGYPLMEDDEELLDIEETGFSNIFAVPEDATVEEALALITVELMPLFESEGIVH